MKIRMAVFGLVILPSVCTTTYAFDGLWAQGSAGKPTRARMLSRLPAEKEMLFHKNMQEAVVTLAKQFTVDEREILVQLFPGERGPGRHSPAQRGR